MIRKSVIVVLSVLGLVVGGLWAVSYDGSPSAPLPLPKWCYLYYQNEQRCLYFASLNGWLRTGELQFNKPFKAPDSHDREVWPWFGSARFPDAEFHREYPGLFSPHLFGVFLSLDYPFASGRMRAVAVPHGLVIGLLLAYPAVAFVRGPVRRWRRRRRGLCVACGYNLTGNVSGVCPECGRGIPSNGVE